jgi:hypothetical protein
VGLDIRCHQVSCLVRCRAGHRALCRLSWYPTRGGPGVEGTIRKAVAVTDIRQARYRGLPKVHLDHVFSAVALTLIRLDAWWNEHVRHEAPLNRVGVKDHRRWPVAAGW